MNRSITRQHIWEAFYALSRTVPFEKMTVEQIIRQSGVSRATFYRHFHDKYDVMNYNVSAVTDRLTGGRACHDWREFLLFLCQEFARDREYYRRAFKTYGQNAHSRFLFEYSFGFVKAKYLSARGQETLNREEQYRIAHYCHGCVDCLEDWLRDPEPMDAEALAELFYAIMPRQIQDTWKSAK